MHASNRMLAGLTGAGRRGALEATGIRTRRRRRGGSIPGVTMVDRGATLSAWLRRGVPKVGGGVCECWADRRGVGCRHARGGRFHWMTLLGVGFPWSLCVCTRESRSFALMAAVIIGWLCVLWDRAGWRA